MVASLSQLLPNARRRTKFALACTVAAVPAVCLSLAPADQPAGRPISAADSTPGDQARSQTVSRPDGKELFTREWRPRDPRSHGGDGLGPLFNEKSCVACHNLGGVGGGGAKEKNVVIFTPDSGFGGSSDISGGWHPFGEYDPLTGRPSFVVHRFSTKDGFTGWLKKHALPEGTFSVSGPNFAADYYHVSTPRNPTALFGAGKIDAIADEVLDEAAKAKFPDYPEVRGRVSALPGGKVGRFGWRAQAATLKEIVLNASAVELGLQVPGKDQSPLPHKPDYKSPGLDMDQPECDALIAFVRNLPAPTQKIPKDAAAAKDVREGQLLFASVGCATCHRPNLGNVEGIYSDLLLHQMGDELADVASSYGNFQALTKELAPPGVTTSQPRVEPQETEPPKRVECPATSLEWRTPPLWGVRDSAPYLHDGRADTLEAAIRLHGGEADHSRLKFEGLSDGQRKTVLAFLKSLAAPTPQQARLRN
jgi:CxxC motif-containing protein (DUF1111 family)